MGSHAVNGYKKKSVRSILIKLLPIIKKSPFYKMTN